MAVLAGQLARLAEAGDDDAARILNEAIGKLLAAPARAVDADILNLDEHRR